MRKETDPGKCPEIVLSGFWDFGVGARFEFVFGGLRRVVFR
jgi:hypothetical protein